MTASLPSGNKRREKPHASSFLDNFLSNAPDPTPQASAPEDAKISDRSAFDRQQLSIEDIVSGLGVSSIASFPGSQPAPPSRTRPALYSARESAIPITPPKKFQAHKLSSFPDKSQSKGAMNTSTPAPKRRQVQPTTYTTGTFSSFRTMSTYTQSRRSISTTPRVHQPSPPEEVKRKARLPTSFPKRSPTQMSAAELYKNPRFRKMSRQYTRLIVGIPFLVVSTYLLYQRADTWDKDEKVLKEIEAAKKPERIRGVMPAGQIGKNL